MLTPPHDPPPAGERPTHPPRSPRPRSEAHPARPPRPGAAAERRLDARSEPGAGLRRRHRPSGRGRPRPRPSRSPPPNRRPAVRAIARQVARRADQARSRRRPGMFSPSDVQAEVAQAAEGRRGRRCGSPRPRPPPACPRVPLPVARPPELRRPPRRSRPPGWRPAPCPAPATCSAPPWRRSRPSSRSSSASAPPRPARSRVRRSPMPARTPCRRRRRAPGSAPRPNSVAGTAVYDITARTVTLPSGEVLEAHSGLGEAMDNPRYVHLRMRGSTPPGTYDADRARAPVPRRPGDPPQPGRRQRRDPRPRRPVRPHLHVASAGRIERLRLVPRL